MIDSISKQDSWAATEKIAAFVVKDCPPVRDAILRAGSGIRIGRVECILRDQLVKCGLRRVLSEMCVELPPQKTPQVDTIPGHQRRFQTLPNAGKCSVVMKQSLGSVECKNWRDR